MVEFIPAILEQDFSELTRRLQLLEGKVDWVQIDIADGDFVPNVTWSDPNQLKSFQGKLKIEIHLMTRAPELELKEWLSLADRIIFHLEATNDVAGVLRLFEQTAVEKVVALLIDTPLETIEPYVSQIDGVQLMGIANIGQQGQPFDERVFPRVKELRRRYVNLNIGIDGGVNLENAPALLEAGANCLVVGSAFWRLVETAGLEQVIHSWQAVMVGQ